MAGYTVGTVTVDVAPSLNKFHEKIRRDIRKIGAIDIPVTPDISAFKRDIKAAARGASVSVDVDVKADTSRANRELDHAARARNVVFNVVTIGDVGVSKFLPSLVSAGKSMASLGAIAGAATVAVGGLSPAIAAVGAAAVSTAAPVAGLAAALGPAALGSAAMAVGSLKMAFSGFGEALKAASPEEFAAAIAELPPAAQAGATALNSLKEQFKGIRDVVQQDFWSNFSNVSNLGVLMQPLQAAMSSLAADMGNAASGLVSFVSAGTGLSAMQTLISGSSTAASYLSYAFADVTKGVIAVGAAASPIFTDMAAKISEVATAWSERMVAGFQDGSLQAFFQGAADKALVLWGVLQQLWGIVSGVFRAMMDAGGGVLSVIGSAIEKTNLWVNSSEGMSTLTGFFRDMQAAAGAVMPVIGRIAEIIFTQLAPILSSFIQTIAPYVVDFFNSLSNALTILAPAIPGVAESLGNILSIFGGWLPIVAQLATIFLPPLLDFFTFLSPILPVVVPLLWGLVAVIRSWSIITGIMTAAQWLFNAAMAANPLVLVAIVIVAAITAIVLAIIYLWNHSDKFRNGIISLWDSVKNAFFAAVEFLKKAWAWVVDAFNSGIQKAISIFNGFKDKISSIWRAISGFFSSGWSGLKEATSEGISKLVGMFSSLPDKIRGAFSGAKNWLFEHGKNIVQGLINGVQNLAPKIGSFFLEKIPGWIKTPFKKALGIHSPSRVFMEYGGFIGEGLQTGIENKMPAIQSVSKDLAVNADVGASTSIGAFSMPDIPSVEGAQVSSGTAKPASSDSNGGDAPSGVSALGAALAGTKAKVIDPALAGIQANMAAMSAGVAASASGVAAPAFAAMGAAMASVKTGAVDPTLSGIRANMAATGTTMQGVVFGQVNLALKAMQASTMQTGQVVSSQSRGVIMPIWSNTGGHIRAVQQGQIEPALRGTRDSVIQTANTFGPAARTIGVQWAQVRPATADPVRFAINTVFNDGIVGMWNSVSELLGTKRMARYPARFATGGYVSGPGGPTSDKIPALLSNGEYVVKADAVNKVGVNNLNALNSGRVSVAPTAYKRDLPRLMETDATFSSIAARYAGGGIVEGSPAWKQLKRGWDWAKSLSGRPYVLGGDPVGGGGTDCSGYMSSIADRIQGGAGHRQWATMAFNGGGNSQYPSGPQGFVKGLGAGFSIGVTNGGAAGGHTAGTLGGVPGLPATNVESGGSPSRVKFGPGAVGADDSYFRTHYHLPVVDGKFISGGGGSGPSMQELVVQAMAPFKNKMNKAVSGFDGKGLVGGVPRSVASKLGDAVTKKATAIAETLGGGDIPGGSGAERWRPMAKRAMARVGFDWRNPAQVNAMIAQIASESSGNPGVTQNGYVDVNTGGNEAVGLLQVTKGTWERFRDPSLPNDRRNPFANMVGALRYYKAQYGMDLTTMWGHGHGYDRGGWLQPGMNATYNGFSKPEAILTPRESEAFIGVARQFSDNGRAGASFTGQHIENQYLVDPADIQWHTERGVKRAMRGEAIHV